MKTLFGTVFLIVVGLQACAEPPKSLSQKKEPNISYIQAQLDTQIQAYADNYKDLDVLKGHYFNNAHMWGLISRRISEDFIQKITEVQSTSHIFRINNFDLYTNHTLVGLLGREQNVFLAHNRLNDEAHFFLPLDLAGYAIKVNELAISIEKMPTQPLILIKNETTAETPIFRFCGVAKTDKYELGYGLDAPIYFQDSLNIHAFALKNSYYFQNIAQLFSQLSYTSKLKIDTLLQILQSQNIYSVEFDRNCYLFRSVKDSFYIDAQSNRIDNKAIVVSAVDAPRLNYDTPIYIDYIPTTVAEMDTMQFLLADGSYQDLTEVAAYARRRQPTFIYYKPFGRNLGSFYAYFLFYYVDFMPFCAPKLRDLEVVFPRRFGIR